MKKSMRTSNFSDDALKILWESTTEEKDHPVIKKKDVTEEEGEGTIL